MYCSLELVVQRYSFLLYLHVNICQPLQLFVHDTDVYYFLFCLFCLVLLTLASFHILIQFSPFSVVRIQQRGISVSCVNNRIANGQISFLYHCPYWLFRYLFIVVYSVQGSKSLPSYIYLKYRVDIFRESVSIYVTLMFC